MENVIYSQGQDQTSEVLMQCTRLSPTSKVVACFGTVHKLFSPFESFSALPAQ